MRIEIKSAEVKRREISNPGTGKSFVVRTQSALMRGTEEVKKFDLALADDVQSYEPGLYEISSESFVVDAYGRMGLTRNLKLERLAATK